MQPEIADLELERTLLAALIADNGNLDRLGRLQPDDLFDSIHASALTAMLDLWADKRLVNVVTLRSRFASVPFRDGESMLGYLKASEFSGSMSDVSDMVVALRELALRRRVKELCQRYADSAGEVATGPRVLLGDLARQIDDLAAECRPAGKTLFTASEATDAALARLNGASKGARITTGLADLDRATGGLRKGEYTVLGGRPSMGKTALAVAVARRAANAGHGVLYLSLEMSVEQLWARVITDSCWSRELPVYYSKALDEDGRLSERELRAYRQSAETARLLPIEIDQQTGSTATEIAARTRQIADRFDREGKRLGLVIVDHMGKITPSKHYRGSRVNEMTEISNAIANLAKDEKVAVLALHQLNRGTEGRENKRPMLSDLRDSGSIEQDADTVMFAYRSAYYLERMPEDGDSGNEAARREKLEKTRNKLEINIAKNRNGPCDNVNLFCDLPANAVRDGWRGG